MDCLVIDFISIFCFCLVLLESLVSHLFMYKFTSLINTVLMCKFCKRQTMRLTLKYTPLVYERRGFLHSSGRLSDHGIK